MADAPEVYHGLEIRPTQQHAATPPLPQHPPQGFSPPQPQPTPDKILASTLDPPSPSSSPAPAPGTYTQPLYPPQSPGPDPQQSLSPYKPEYAPGLPGYQAAYGALGQREFFQQPGQTQGYVPPVVVNMGNVGKEKRICGIRRKIFFIILVVVVILVIGAIVGPVVRFVLLRRNTRSSNSASSGSSDSSPTSTSPTSPTSSTPSTSTYTPYPLQTGLWNINSSLNSFDGICSQDNYRGVMGCGPLELPLTITQSGDGYRITKSPYTDLDRELTPPTSDDDWWMANVIDPRGLCGTVSNVTVLLGQEGQFMASNQHFTESACNLDNGYTSYANQQCNCYWWGTV